MTLNINVSKSVTERPFPEPSKQELEKMLRELIVRFDTSPKLYEKKDFGLLIKCIVSLFSFQGKQSEEIEKLLANNGRIVNGLEKPEKFVPGYSWLDKNANQIITYKNSISDFTTYSLANGDGIFVMESRDLYNFVDGNLKLTGSLEGEGKQSWADL